VDWLQKYYQEAYREDLTEDAVIVGTCPGTYFLESPILVHCPKIYLPKKEKCRECWGLEAK